MERQGDASESVFKPGPRVTDCRFGTDRAVGWGCSVTNHGPMGFTASGGRMSIRVTGYDRLLEIVLHL
jgi:hypothetical protein